MGRPKYIYLTEQNYIRLSDEGDGNQAKLVNKLLNEHYDKLEKEKATPVQKDVQISQEIEELKAKMELLEEQRADLEKEAERAKLEELSLSAEQKRLRELKKQWAEEMKPIPFDDRIKWKDWLAKRENRKV